EDVSIKRNQSLGEVARISCNAIVTRTQHSMHAVEAGNGGAARTGRALVASIPARVAKVRTARALQHVAPQARHVADLLAGSEIQALTNDRIVATNVLMISGIDHTYQCPEI